MAQSEHILAESQRQPEDQAVREHASDPSVSCLVVAPAGSGKTSILVQRYLRLLAVVNQPEEIVAVTFTIKAAQEMRNRVLTALRNEEFAAAGALERNLKKQWNVIQNPHRLRIQTIGSFAMSLVRRLPYESQLNLRYQPTENPEPFYREAALNVFKRMYEKHPLSDAIATVAAAADNDVTKAAGRMAQMLASREMWIDLIMEFAQTSVSSGVDKERFVQALRQGRVNYIRNALDQFKARLSEEELEDLLRFIEFSQTAEKIIVKVDPDYPWDGIAEFFLTKSNNLRKTPTGKYGVLVRQLPNLIIGRWKYLRKKIFESNLRLVERLAKIRNLPRDDALSPALLEVMSSLAVALVLAINELNAIFEREQKLDFVELAIAAKRALSVDSMPTELALALDYRISHILVDEFQDTSMSQFEFFNSLMEGWTPGDGNTFFAVGDPMQSIYKFRDADLSNFLHARQHGLPNRSLKNLNLTTNFRTLPRLVEWANETFASIFDKTEDADVGQVVFVDSVPYLPEGGDYQIRVFREQDRHAEAQAVAEKVLALRANPETGEREKIAMLMRARTHLEAYFEAFQRNGITWHGKDIGNMQVGVVRDLFSLTTTLIDPKDRLSWLALLRSPLIGLELPDLETLGSIDSFEEVLDRYENLDLSQHALAAVARLDALYREAQLDNHRSLRSRLERMWYLLGGQFAYREPGFESTHLVNAERFFDVIEDFDSEAFHPEELRERIDRMPTSVKAEDADLEIMSIHGAKGLEFDHVLLPDLAGTTRAMETELFYLRSGPQDGLLMTVNAEGELDQLHAKVADDERVKYRHEAKRLFYVAVTRAKRSLSLFGTFKSDAKKPPSGSFLNLIYPRCKRSPNFKEIRSDEEELEAPAKKTRIYRRLASDFEYFEPEPSVTFNPACLLDPKDETRVDLPPTITTNLATAIGRVVHAELHYMVANKRLAKPDEARVAYWRNSLRAEGLIGTELVSSIATVRQHIENTLNDEVGQWLLSDAHLESGAEVSYVLNRDDEFDVMRLDRTFVDARGQRWIVDYKTTLIGRPTTRHIDQIRAQHAEQLNRYAQLMRELDNRPIKLAVYSTDIPKLIDIELWRA